MSTSLQGICSMATRGLLVELAAAYKKRTGVSVLFEAVGGVEAAKRVAAGERFDVVALASDALDKLIAAGHLDGGGKADLVRSGVGVAVRAGAAHPDIANEEAVRRAVLAAPSIGYSTGPSGVALVALFERWGIADQVESRLVRAAPGVPVGGMVAQGDAALGLQQLSELIGVEGIDLLGPLPPEIQIASVFSAAPGVETPNAGAVRALLAFMTAPPCDEAKRRHGLEAA